MLQNCDKPQNISVSKFSTEQNNVVKLREYFKDIYRYMYNFKHIYTYMYSFLPQVLYMVWCVSKLFRDKNIGKNNL
jgi:hypothetical protein